MSKLSDDLDLWSTLTQKNCREWINEAKRLEEFEEELTAMVDRLGHDGGAVCNWDSRNKLPAKVWADAAYEAARDNEQHEREQGRREVQQQLDACALELKELKAAYEELKLQTP